MSDKAKNIGDAVVDRETEQGVNTEEETYPMPQGGWTCFHCNEVFTTRETAAEHFGNGDYETEIPLCIEAATTEQRQLILTNREMWEELQKARNENEDLEYRLGGWEYTARKLTKKPSATTHDLEHEWDFMEGRVIAAEAQLKASGWTPECLSISDDGILGQASHS